MKRLALVAAVLLLSATAACTSSDEAATDTGAAMSPAPADTGMQSDTGMMMQHDTTDTTDTNSM